MNTAAKLAGFAAIVAVAFGGAAALGAAAGPIDVGADPDHATHDAGGSAADLPRGLAVAQAGHRLVLDPASPTPGAPGPAMIGFTIVREDGSSATAFDELHERPLHLIVLSRNLVDYHHLHPTMDPTGHWSVPAPELPPGSYRVFADFQPTGGENLTLGADLTVTGEVAPTELPPAAATDTVGDYTVAMTGSPAVGASELSFTVARDGQAVTTEPYLGAQGHLVAIRSGDLAYLHVHPHDDAAGTTVTFTGEFPSAGTYRLFFDFAHDGAVHTAAFTVEVGNDEVADDSHGDADDGGDTDHDTGEGGH